jgi:sugar phosphate isomerase/epimerase
MQLFLSTTFHGTAVTEVDEVLRLLDGLDIDGIELGSTHIDRSDLRNVIKECCNKNIVTHNFFPPAKRKDFVMNIASINSEVRSQSVNHARYCIKFAVDIGASVYTIHPGFLATPDVNKKNSHTYDFNFTKERVNKKIAFANMVDSLFLLIETAKENKIKLAIETEGSLTEPGVLLMETIEEYDELFSVFLEDIFLNLNLAHTRFASIEHRYKMDDFIKHYYNKIVLVEVSHNNGKIDQHLPLTADSYVFNYLSLLPDVPHILEFRNSNIDQIKHSITLMRNFKN